MKIVFVTSTLTSGGSERVISLLANEFCKRGYEVAIVCLTQKVVFYPLNEHIRIVFAEDHIHSRNIFGMIFWMRKYLASDRPDVVIPFMNWVYCVTLLAVIGLHIPVICSERANPKESSVIRKLLRFVCLPMTNHLVVQTKEIMLYYPEFIRNKASVIYNPVTEDAIRFKREKQEYRIVSVGKLHHQKNHRMLIEAFSLISKKYESLSLCIFGEGPLRDELESLIKKKGLVNRVFLPGRSTNIVEEVGSSLLFCLSSNYEGMSNALIEAVCVGVPVVATDVSGAKEVIGNDGGIVVPVGDAVKMAEAMDKLLSDEQKRKNMTAACLRKRGLFEINTVANQWEKLIYNVVNNIRL